MKRYLVLFFSFFCFCCSTEKQQLFTDICPEVFFSKNHRFYITTENQKLTLNTISYQAEINNSKFIDGCSVNKNIFTGKLSTLFVAKPDQAKKSNIVMPYYVALLDQSNNIVDIQYFKVVDNLNLSEESIFVETEIIDTQYVIFKYNDKNLFLENKILIGFMLNKEKINILN